MGPGFGEILPPADLALGGQVPFFRTPAPVHQGGRLKTALSDQFSFTHPECGITGPWPQPTRCDDLQPSDSRQGSHPAVQGQGL